MDYFFLCGGIGKPGAPWLYSEAENDIWKGSSHLRYRCEEPKFTLRLECQPLDSISCGTVLLRWNPSVRW